MTRKVGGQNQCLGPTQGPSQGSGHALAQAKSQGQGEKLRYTQHFAGLNPAGVGNQNTQGLGV